MTLSIDLLSDTHGQHNRFKCTGGDIFLHSGDITSSGSLPGAIYFLDWLEGQEYDHKVIIAGNHDWVFEEKPSLMKDECLNRGIVLLNDSSVLLKPLSPTSIEEDYSIRIHGSPITPWFNSWAFNRERGPIIKNHWDMIPKNTEILITHGPPAGTLDVVVNADGTPKGRVGCEDLLNAIKGLDKLKMHVFGHIHESRGILEVDGKIHINASSLDQYYSPASNKPIRIYRKTSENGIVTYEPDQIS